MSWLCGMPGSTLIYFLPHPNSFPGILSPQPCLFLFILSPHLLPMLGSCSAGTAQTEGLGGSSMGPGDARRMDNPVLARCHSPGYLPTFQQVVGPVDIKLAGADEAEEEGVVLPLHLLSHRLAQLLATCPLLHQLPQCLHRSLPLLLRLVQLVLCLGGEQGGGTAQWCPLCTPKHPGGHVDAQKPGEVQ